jgi:hypothetical protein
MFTHEGANLIARLHDRGQLSPRVDNYLNSRLVHVRCHLISRPLMTLRTLIARVGFHTGCYLRLAYIVRT